MQRIDANDDGCIFIDDHRPISHRLRFCRINITADYSADETFLIKGFGGTEAGYEFVIKNPPKSSRVVLSLCSHPFVFEVYNFLFRIRGWLFGVLRLGG